jgi:MoxR-like ATPase
MTPTTLTRTLTHAFRNRLKVLLVSSPGVGKSALVEIAARQAEADLIIMHPAVSDPTDFKGMPAIVKKGSTSIAEFLPFGNLRQLTEAKALTVCFIDDIGQAPHSVQAALMQLIQAREVDGQKISDHVVFAGATNDSSHMAGVSSILEPVKSRWHTIVTLDCSVDDWVAWALGAGLAPAVIAFIRFRPELLNNFKATRELKNSPSPRTVEAVSQWVNSGIEDYEIIAGAAGEAFAVEFTAFLKVWRSVPDLDAIIANPTGSHVPTGDPSLTVALACALAYKADKANFPAILTYLARLPKEYEVLAVRDAANRLPALYETPAYTNWVINNQSVFA